MNNQVSFDSLLRMAVRETYMDQVNSIPPEDELEKILHTDDNFKNKIRAIVRKENRNEKLIHFSRAAAKVAVVVLVCISLTFASLMTADAVRESVATTILEWHDKFTRIFIETDAVHEKLPEIRFNYIPEGFELVEEECVRASAMSISTYVATNNKFLKIFVKVYDKESDDNVDNENINLYKININQNYGTWLSSSLENKLIIQNKGILFNISGTLSIEEIIKIYEKIEIL